MFSFGDAKREWAIIAGELRHVSDFADLDSKDRPEALCEDCNNPLIYKCGIEKAHHFCHQPGDECSGGGEGIEHQKAKIKIAEVLKKTNQITVFNRCCNCHTLAGKDISIFFDDVQLEFNYADRMRADVGLLKDGQLCCGIEVFVSHKCGREKILFHQINNIPCVEIDADYANRWQSPKKITPYSIYGVERVRCFVCETKPLNFELANKHSEKREIKESFPSKPEQRVKAWQSIFCQQNSQIKRKFIIDIIELIKGDSIIKYLRFYEGSSIPQVLCHAIPPYTNEQRILFKQKYDEFINQLKSQGYQIDVKKWNKT
ncbi:MAG TPA: competence protein CoiA family protein [Pyrinomonadaceae bacterium]|nr:competence protein CoiA family protein [Pyrinomonadaceae bacterium]